jgi:ankyrin repeat protein
MRMPGKVAAVVANAVAKALTIALLCAAAASATTANVDEPRKPDGSTPLMWATFEGDVEEAARLLKEGADVKASNSYGVNALHLAADSANTELIRLLLKAGADPESPNADGETALHVVARSGNVEAAKLLLKAGGKVNAVEQFGGQTPLMWAAARRHPQMVELLLSKGADVNARGAVRDYKRVATAESRAAPRDRGGFTPLMYAARGNCRECVEVLLKHKADVNLADPSFVVPLSIAMMNSNWDIAKRLVEAGADVNQWDMNGNSPLHVAIANMGTANNRNPLDQDKPNKASGRDVIKMLLDRGANPNQQLYWGTGFSSSADRGMTPFLAACATGDIELVKLLLEHGANPKLATSDGRGPIIMAVIGRRVRNSFFGSPPPATRSAEGEEDSSGDAGEGARAGAAGGAPGRGAPRANPQVELIRLLAEAGADVKLVGKIHLLARTRGGSALHYAVRGGGNRQVIQELLDLGLEVNVKDADGLTALDYAMGRGYVPFLAMPEPPNKSLADFLRGKGANIELAKTPDWPPQGPPIATAVYDSFIWPVDPVGP